MLGKCVVPGVGEVSPYSSSCCKRMAVLIFVVGVQNIGGLCIPIRLRGAKARVL